MCVCVHTFMSQQKSKLHDILALGLCHSQSLFFLNLLFYRKFWSFLAQRSFKLFLKVFSFLILMTSQVSWITYFKNAWIFRKHVDMLFRWLTSPVLISDNDKKNPKKLLFHNLRSQSTKMLKISSRGIVFHGYKFIGRQKLKTEPLFPDSGFSFSLWSRSKTLFSYLPMTSHTRCYFCKIVWSIPYTWLPST